jgi:hypothetical protein
MEEMRNTYKILLEKLKGRLLGMPRCICEDNSKPIKSKELLVQISDYQLLKKDPA